MLKRGYLMNSCIIPLCGTNLLPARCQTSIDIQRKRVHKQNRRAERMGLEATLTLPQWLAVLEAHGWLCYFCQGPYESVEHLVPLSWGGGSSADNCVPCCVACNNARGTVSAGIKHQYKLLAEGKAWLITDLLYPKVQIVV